MRCLHGCGNEARYVDRKVKDEPLRCGLCDIKYNDGRGKLKSELAPPQKEEDWTTKAAKAIVWLIKGAVPPDADIIAGYIRTYHEEVAVKGGECGSPFDRERMKEELRSEMMESAAPDDWSDIPQGLRKLADRWIEAMELIREHGVTVDKDAVQRIKDELDHEAAREAVQGGGLPFRPYSLGFGFGDLTVSRESLRLGKYTRAYKDLTPDQLVGLLWLVGEVAARITPSDVDENMKNLSMTPAENRSLEALKALLRFSHSPMGVDEVRALIRRAATETP